MKSVNRIILAVCAFSFLGFSLVGAQEVNYSGSWKLDKEKSTLQGRMSEMLVGLTLVITQKANDLTAEFQYKMQENDRTDKFTLAIGGAQMEGEGMMGRGTTKRQAKWSEDKKNLIITSESTGGQFSMKNTDKYDLSADGKTLTINRESESSRGARSSKMVFTKQ